ncbi:hypothetical protein [Flaviaesturariibacter amylovorans]|uniref:DUF4265 domain-containing protein n=1 Tax=Flaviaesturariibacter amylovorans TaxID=1084520 RepID=A0ABP8HUK1_9BACT
MEQPALNILFEIPHVRFVSLGADGYCLIVEDTAVNDFVEDHLWDDYEYSATSVSMDTEESIPLYYNYLPPELPADEFIEALRRLDPADVEKVFQSNQ